MSVARAVAGVVAAVSIAASALWVASRPPASVLSAAPAAVVAPALTTTSTTALPPPVAPHAPADANLSAPPPPPPATPAVRGPFGVATPRAATTPIYAAPNGAISQQQTNPTHDALALVFLVRARAGDGWLEVFLPTRPNGSTGFVRTSDVTLSLVTTQVKIERGLRRLTAWDGDTMIAEEAVAVGKAASPTPLGLFYMQEAHKVANPRGAYGPYILGLSAHSEVYTRFGGGDGLVGIHGTNAPHSVGKPVSNGCVRMTNAAVARLAGLLRPGTPVVIVP